jgi:hypothetical protein
LQVAFSKQDERQQDGKNTMELEVCVCVCVCVCVRERETERETKRKRESDWKGNKSRRKIIYLHLNYTKSNDDHASLAHESAGTVELQRRKNKDT